MNRFCKNLYFIRKIMHKNPINVINEHLGVQRSSTTGHISSNERFVVKGAEYERCCIMNMVQNMNFAYNFSK